MMNTDKKIEGSFQDQNIPNFLLIGHIWVASMTSKMSAPKI